MQENLALVFKSVNEESAFFFSIKFFSILVFHLILSFLTVCLF